MLSGMITKNYKEGIEDKKNNGYTYKPNKESYYTYIEYLKTHTSKRHTYGDYLRYKKEHKI